MDDSIDLTQEIDIDASPELVFRFFTDAELLGRWLCAHAEIDPRPGGALTLNVTGTHITRGMFRELEPGRRLVFTWLFDHVQPPMPTTVEVTLTPLGRGTRVRLRHYGFADQDTARPPRQWLGALPATPGCRRFRGGPRTGRLAHGRRRRSGPVAAATERLRPATPPPPGALPVLRRPWTWSLTNPASLSGGWSIRE